MEQYNRTREYFKLYNSYLDLKTLPNELINTILNDHRIIIFEFTKRPSDYFLNQLENEILSIKSNIVVRLYGYQGVWKDLSFLKKISSLKMLRLEESELEDLSSIEELEDLRYFSLEKSQNKKLSIKSLEKFLNLQELRLEGKKRDMDIVLKLKNIEKLSLFSCKEVDMALFENTKNLKRLIISGGNIENLQTISNFQYLEYLYLDNLRELDNVEFIRNLSSIIFLYLGRIPNLTQLPNFKNCKSLKKIELENNNKVTNLKSILTATDLEEFRWTSNKIGDPEDFFFLAQLSKLRYLYITKLNAVGYKVYEEYINSFDKIFTPIPSGKFEYLTM
jgi:hypothetical protein